MSVNDREKDGGEKSALLTSRARNRTVMLSSDMTGQVRSLIQEKNPQDQDTESTDEDHSKSNHGFVAPFSLSQSPVAPEVTPKRNYSSQNKTELVGGAFEMPSAEKKMTNESGFVSVSKEQENNEVHFPASVKEILKTKELGKIKAHVSDTSTLIHPAHPTFDSERGSLVKARKETHKARILGFLISFDKDEYGEILDIREGRSIVSSKYSDQSEVLFIDDDSISNPHAVIKADKSGRILLLDQLSELGSSVTRSGVDAEIDSVGTPVELKHGDIVRLGSRYFIFCAVPKIAIQD